MKKLTRWGWVVALLVAAPQAAFAQGIAVGSGPGTDESVSTPPETPAWATFFHKQSGSFIKPVLAIAGGFNYEVRRNVNTTTNESLNLSPLKTAVAAVLFGVEGKVSDWATFHSEFRRDPGPYGTSIWQGSISLTAMDNYVQLEHWGASLAGGIVSDPSSADFISSHVLDMFVTDDFTLLPALLDGYNRGQGLRARYTWKGLTAGLFFSAGNPLTTSLSYGFGGNVGPDGSLIQTPLAQLASGVPRNGFEMDVLSPSLMFEHKYVELRANAQFYWVNTDTETGKNVGLKGQLVRGGIKGKIWKDRIQPFANVAHRTNDMTLQTSPIDLTKLNPTGYSATIVSGGLDVNVWGPSGVGVNYAFIHSSTGDLPAQEDHYLNVGGTYWVVPNIAVSARYAKIMTTTAGKGIADGRMDRDGLYLVMRLVL